MAKLANELSWSRSRIATLHHCRRQYWFQYYGKWGGWEWDAPEDAKKAYFFSKMTDLPMLLGDAVHRTIKALLESIRDGQGGDLPDPVLAARKLMTKVWDDAKKEYWRKSVKNHPPVFEIYYRSEPSAEALKELGAKAARCIRGFVESDLFAELKSTDPSAFLAVDPGPGFDEKSKHRVDGTVVWALPDFVRGLSPSGCEIWDWKTGKPSSHDATQLSAYALWATDRFGCRPEDVRLKAFYLGEGKIADYPFKTADALAIRELIRKDMETMRGLLADPIANVPLDRDRSFPMTDDLAACARCVFKELCGRS